MKSLNWLVWLVLVGLFLGGLASMDRNVHIAFPPWDVDMPFGALCFLLFMIGLLFVVLDRFIQNLSWFERMQKARNMRKARATMLRGFGHLAVHDIESAQEAAAKVDKLWQDDEHDPFRLVFNGRLAEEEGAWDRAQEAYKRLEQNKDTRLYALRAQLRLAQTQRNRPLLQKLSQQALKLSPDDFSMYAICMDAMIDQQQWGKAHHVLHKMNKRHLISPDRYHQRKAQLYLDEAETALLNNQPGKAQMLAAKAHKIDNTAQGWALEIEAMLAQGHRRAAIKHLQKAWAAKPDRSLLPLWSRLAPDGDTFTFYEAMLSANPQSALTHAALVRAAIKDNMSMEARAHLDVLKRHHEDGLEYAESMALVADKLNHDKNEARLWSGKAELLRKTGVKTPVALTVDLKDPL